MPKVVLISNLPDDIKAAVLSYAPAGYETASIGLGASDDEKLALTHDAEFVILYGGTVSEVLLKGSPRLKHVQLLSAGYDRIDLQLTASYGVAVSNNGGANSWAVAEATVAMILALYQRLTEADHFVREGRWRGDIQGFDTYELAGKTVGIVGLATSARRSRAVCTLSKSSCSTPTPSRTRRWRRSLVCNACPCTTCCPPWTSSPCTCRCSPPRRA